MPGRKRTCWSGCRTRCRWGRTASRPCVDAARSARARVLFVEDHLLGKGEAGRRAAGPAHARPAAAASFFSQARRSSISALSSPGLRVADGGELGRQRVAEPRCNLARRLRLRRRIGCPRGAVLRARLVRGRRTVLTLRGLSRNAAIDGERRPQLGSDDDPARARTGRRALAQRLAIEDGDVRLDFTQLAAEVERATRAFLAAGIVPETASGSGRPMAGRGRWRHSGSTARAACSYASTRASNRTKPPMCSRRARAPAVRGGEFLGMNYAEAIAARAAATRAGGRVLRLCENARPWSDFSRRGARERRAARERAASVEAEDLSDILFTSGTTGFPKA